MNQIIDTLFTQTWWKWNPSDGQWFSLIYHWFNILEGIAWIVFAALVFQRYSKHRKSLIELAYSATVLAFAAPEFREAGEQSSWLIWLKLVNLIALLWLRRVVMQRCYPNAKIY